MYSETSQDKLGVRVSNKTKRQHTNKTTPIPQSGYETRSCRSRNKKNVETRHN